MLERNSIVKLGRSVSAPQASCVPSIYGVNICFVGDLAKANVQQMCYVSVLTVLLKETIREAAELYSEWWTNTPFWNVLIDEKKTMQKKNQNRILMSANIKRMSEIERPQTAHR